MKNQYIYIKCRLMSSDEVRFNMMAMIRRIREENLFFHISPKESKMNVKVLSSMASIVFIGLLLQSCSDGEESSPSAAGTQGATPQGVVGNSNVLVDARDGKSYRTVTIGTQTWMAQNLNYVTVGGKADNLKGSVCYNLDENYCNVYGRLYDKMAALNMTEQQYNQVDFYIQSPYHQGICPDGWHLPTHKDLQTLYFISANYDVNSLMAINGGEPKLCYGLMMQPGECTESSSIDYNWENATNALGFSLLAGGKAKMYAYAGTATFVGIGVTAYLWSIRDTDGKRNIYGSEFRGPNNYLSETQVYIGSSDNDFSYSVRCIKN